jgi:hypothetical protein
LEPTTIASQLSRPVSKPIFLGLLVSHLQLGGFVLGHFHLRDFRAPAPYFFFLAGAFFLAAFFFVAMAISFS